MNRSNYLTPVCKTVWVQTARPLASSDPNILKFGEDDAPGGRINNEDIFVINL